MVFTDEGTESVSLSNSFTIIQMVNGSEVRVAFISSKTDSGYKHIYLYVLYTYTHM